MASIFDDMKKDNEEVGGFRGLLGNLMIPGSAGNFSNKDLINAAILRGSLELLKPKQPGENIASQLGRGLQAGAETTKLLQSQGNDKIDDMLKRIELQEKFDVLKERKTRELGDFKFPEVKYSKDQEDADLNLHNAFNVADMAAAGISELGGQVGADLFAEQRQAKATFDRLRNDLLTFKAQSVTGRPSVYYFQLSETEVPQYGVSDFKAREKYREIRDKYASDVQALKDEYKLAEREVDRSKIRNNIKNAEYIIKRLDTIDYGFSKDMGEPLTGAKDNIYSGTSNTPSYDESLDMSADEFLNE